MSNETTGAYTVTVRPASGGGVAVDQAAHTLIYCDGLNVYPVASGTGGGGGSGAPTDASYLVGSAHALLSGERVVTDTPTVTWDLATAGQAQAQVPDDAITFAKLQPVATGTVLGRYTAGSGDVQALTLSTGLAVDASGNLTATATGQPLDATLTALAGLATGADQLPFFTGTDTAAQTPLTAFARTLLDDASQAAMRTTLALTPGTDVQPQDATLTALAGVTTGADQLPFFTGVDTASTTALTAFMRALLDDPDAATARATLGVSGAGAVSFLELTDSPDSYTGQAGKVVQVNAGATALEFGTPAGGETLWERGTLLASTLTDGLLAFWRMEEASGTRVDSVASIALAPTGTPTNAAGKTGQALAFDTTASTYLSAADSATLSVGTNQSFTIACWIYFNGTPSGARGVVGKGNASIAYANCEYLLGTSGTQLQWYIGNGSSSANLAAAGVTLAAATWYCVVAWYDATADLMFIQVDNGTPSQLANANGSFDSAGPVEVGRQPQWSGSTPFDGRIDNVAFWKRTLTNDERTALYNGGAGQDYPPTAGGTPVGMLSPVTSTDMLVLEASALTPSGVVNGTTRWSGTDLEVRKGGAWVSLTSVTDPELLALSLLTSAADTLPYFTGSGTAALATFTAAGRALAGGADAAAQRTTLGLGTLATQDASAVAITDGRISIGGHSSTGVLDVQGSVQASDAPLNYHCARLWPVAPSGATVINGVRIEPATGASIATTDNRPILILNQPTTSGAVTGIDSRIASGTGRYNIYAGGTAPNYFEGGVSIGGTLIAGSKSTIKYDKTGTWGLDIQQLNTDTGGGQPVGFVNVAGTLIGSISTNATTTAYNTSSDVRLKHAVAALAGALDVVAALRPVSFRWNADDSLDIGFLGHELQREVPTAATGEPDAVNPDGSVKPMQVDHSKLVPILVAAVKELLARVAALEDALGA